MAKIIFWTIKDLVDIAKKRQDNEFDVIIFWSGRRGNGKSTGAYKFNSRFDCFRPWDDIVYCRKDVMKLMEGRIKKNIMDDEAVRSGYKRNFQDPDQKTLIAMINMYRDNFNIYSGLIPNFYDLDKDLRGLCTIHIHVIERGLAVVHLPNESLYKNDIWDVAYNAKIEEKWAEIKKKNPNFRPPYHKLSTFAGYLTYGKLGKKQEDLYKDIKRTKRKKVYDKEMRGEDSEETDIYVNLIPLLKEGKVDQNGLQSICLANGLKYSTVTSVLNRKLKDMGEKNTLKHFLRQPEDKNYINTIGENVKFPVA